MKELIRRIKLRVIYEIKKFINKPLRNLKNPYVTTENKQVIIHCCYHKVGTVWFGRILREIGACYGLRYQSGSNYQKIYNFETMKNADIFLDLGSHVNLNLLNNYIGSHMIRDPRDIIISGYYYHLWTNETWANLPMVEYRGMSYKEYLNSLTFDEGLMAEIRRVWYWIPHMAKWDYKNSRIYEIKYENIMINEEEIFRQMFQHYGFNQTAVEKCCKIAAKYSYKKLKKGIKTQKKGKSHLRSGKCGEWKKLFNSEHKKLFKELYPGALKALGYEKDESW